MPGYRKGDLAGWSPEPISEDLKCAKDCRGCEPPTESALDFTAVTGSLIIGAKPEGKPTSGAEA